MDRELAIFVARQLRRGQEYIDNWRIASAEIATRSFNQGYDAGYGDGAEAAPITQIDQSGWGPARVIAVAVGAVIVGGIAGGVLGVVYGK